MSRYLLPLCALLPLLSHAAPALRFSPDDIARWEEKSFSGQTRYALTTMDGERVLQAQVNGGASGKFRQIRIDLTQTPYLHWRWKVGQSWPGLNERSKGGDDYPARLYVVVERGPFGLASKTVNYVWSGNQAIGKQWPNAFTKQAVLIAVENGAANVGQWRSYKRDLRADLKAAFGEDIRQIDAIAIMSDGDNSQQKGNAWYGDIWLTAD